MHRPRHYQATHRLSARPTTVFGRLALLVPVLSLAAVPTIAGVTGVTGSAAGAATPRIYFGIDGTAKNLPKMSVHVYSQITRKVPPAGARMITMGTGGVHWAAVAAAKPGSATYANLVRWADTLKTRPGPIFLTVAHEPEASGQRAFGTAAQYIAAYRHVVTIFRGRGVKNVQWTWQMSAYSFHVPSSDPRAAARWYPGNAYVNDVAGDGYNWSGCRHTPVRQMSFIAGPMVAFARAHGKGAILGEFGDGIGPTRAQWLKNAKAYFIANANTFRAAYYFDHAESWAGCSWIINTAADVAAIESIARDSHFTTA
jgi:hypothetical protein